LEIKTASYRFSDGSAQAIFDSNVSYHPGYLQNEQLFSPQSLLMLLAFSGRQVIV
jgi:hypothetical protein